MLTGREQETAFLENHYKRTGSQILVVYGQRGVGKTALLTSFTEKKQTLRYSAGNCSSREQQYLWGRELRSRGKEIAEYPSWRELLECMTIQKGETTADKKVLIIENFQYLLKGDTLFLQELIRFLRNGTALPDTDPDYHAILARSYEKLGKKSLQYQHTGEMYALLGADEAAVYQYSLAQKANDGDFYTMSVIDARLRELREAVAQAKKDR